jgi:hypothetical protein
MGARKSTKRTGKAERRSPKPVRRGTERIADSLSRNLESFAPEELIQGEARALRRRAERVPSGRRRRQKDYNWDIVIGETD